MPSQAQIDANRANSQRSTGPRTSEGKARAASNSFKHGLYAPKHFQVYNADPNYSAALMLNYTGDFQPVTPSEHTLLQQLIHQQIRYQHIQAHYTQLIDWYCAKPATPETDLVCHPDLADALAFERMANESKVLPLLLRELDRMPTRIRRTIDALRKLIKNRLENERNEPNSVDTDPIEDLLPIPMRPEKSESEVITRLNRTKSEEFELDPAARTRLQHLPGNYLWNLLLHFTFEDFPDELANFYSELEKETAAKAEIEASEREKQGTNPIAA